MGRPWWFYGRSGVRDRFHGEERMSRRRIALGVLLAALMGVTMAASARASSSGAGVTIALTPAGQQVAPGAQFDLSIDVTQAGDSFNGFDLMVGYDPAALTLVPMNPIDLQQGSYMTNACGNTFHVFKAHAGVDTITDVLLCSGVSLPGPGQIYQLRFQASDTPQLTQVRFLPGGQFYDAGLYVSPLSSSDATITIGSPVGVGMPGAAGLSLSAAPNPASGHLTFTIESAGGPQSLTVFDLQGRVVRRLENGAGRPGIRLVSWDGRTDAGLLAAPGIYLARLQAQERAVWVRVTLIH